MEEPLCALRSPDPKAQCVLRMSVEGFELVAELRLTPEGIAEIQGFCLKGCGNLLLGFQGLRHQGLFRGVAVYIAFYT